MSKVESPECELNVEPSSQAGGAVPDETRTHSFIVKVWLEETVAEAGKARWRGHITHVPSGERVYLQTLGEICLFVAPFLESLKVRLGYRWRVWRWLFRVHK
jgi:hypothetical protein